MALRFLIALFIVAGAGAYARVLEANRVAAGQPPRLGALPAAFGDWRSQDIPMSPSVAKVLGADLTLQRVYQNSSRQQVEVFLAYFSRQAVNSQIHSPRHCLPGAGWTIVSTEPTNVDLPGGTQPATRMILQREGVSEQMLYWFRTRSGSVTGEYALKFDLVRNSLARRPTDAVFVRYVAHDKDTAAMRDVMATLEKPLQAVLSEAGLH
jgi:EpsI family protein